MSIFGKFRGAKIEVLQTQVDFGGNLPVREVARSQKQRMQSKTDSIETPISEMKEMIQKYAFASCAH